MDRATVRADSTLSYAVLVVAISGSTVIGIDLRATGNSQYVTTSGRAFLQAAADAAEPYIVPSRAHRF
jgi:hypothetical protein